MITKYFLILVIGCCVSLKIMSQKDTTVNKSKKDIIKKGWTLGGVPAIAFDSDVGFKYGAVVNFYNFGDGSTYPKYMHSIYLEWSRTTKGSGINQFIYDSEYLIPGIRLMVEASLLTEQNLDFYGFNGYEAYYNHSFETDTSNQYISRMYYRHQRKLGRLGAEFQGKIIGKKLRWVAGYNFYHNNIQTVDINKLNKGKDSTKMLPNIPLLYDQYVSWGIIPADQKNGGGTHLLKAGIVYDTRDNEPNPMKGIWSEIVFQYAPSKTYSFAKIMITHRQYFTLLPDILNFAYRIGYQGKLFGKMPFYMLPYLYNTAPQLARDGLGGAKTIRGVLRNRVVGEDMLYGNLEFRWKFLRTTLWKQNIYLALSGFLDGGMVTGKYDINISGVPANMMYLFPDKKEKPHFAYGGGFHFVLNRNFIIAVDYGRPLTKDDGRSGIYIGLNFLY